MGEGSGSSITFGDLSSEEAFKSCILKYHTSVDKVGDLLQLCCGHDVHSSLSPEDRVQYDLFLSYALNSLFWTYLRTQGIDPSQHGVKDELDRVRNYMTKAKQVHDRQKMPRLDKDAAERFISSGLWEPGQSKIQIQSVSSENRVNKRKTFESDSED